MVTLSILVHPSYVTYLELPAFVRRLLVLEFTAFVLACSETDLRLVEAPLVIIGLEHLWPHASYGASPHR